MYKDRDTFISKKISYALRHDPEKYDLKLAADGSVPIEKLLKALNRVHGFEPPVTEEDVRRIMANAEKQRYAVENGRIRALYGHTAIHIDYPVTAPPEILYHGTAHKFLDSIKQEGLLPMGREYVHLSADIPTAQTVGRRRDGHPVILQVDAAKAYADGVKFYYVSDKVWLTDQIPPQYLHIMKIW